jgi:Fic family protein
MILIRRGVCIRVVPPVSLVLAANSDSYIAGLTSWRFGNPLDWIEFFARAVSEAARAMESLGRNIHDLQEQWALSAGQPRQSSAARMLIDALPTVPVLSLSTACEVTGLSDEACRRALNRLADAGVLNETTAGKRYRVWEAAGLFGLLDQIERGVAGDH